MSSSIKIYREIDRPAFFGVIADEDYYTVFPGTVMWRQYFSGSYLCNLGFEHYVRVGELELLVTHGLTIQDLKECKLRQQDDPNNIGIPWTE